MAPDNKYIDIFMDMFLKLPCGSFISFSNWQCQIFSWLEFAN